MRAGAQARIIYAGFGAAGSLLAAVGTIFVVLGSVLAFDHWPGSPGAAPESSLSLRSAAGVAKPARVQVLARAPVPAPSPSTARRPARRPTPRSGRPPAVGTGRAPLPTVKPSPGRPAPAVPVPPIVPTAPAAPARGALAPVADAVQSTAYATAGTLHSVGAALPVAAPVTDLLAVTVADAGGALGGVVRGLLTRP